MKVTMIGPVYPYKGGISHYTGLMYKALCQKYEVQMVSYKLQYPKLLFKKEQRDYSNDSFKVEGTQFLINTVNPFNWITSGLKLRKSDADLIIMQWWHPYFAPCYFVMSKLLKKKKILFVCHNVFPHERFPLDKFLCKLVLKQGNCFVVQSHLDETDLLTICPNAKYIVTPHPTYSVFNMTNMSKEDARTQLGIKPNAPTMLFFGFVREYKGLKYLLKALPYVKKQISDIQLWIVGDFGEDKNEYLKLIEENGINESIKIVEGYIPDKEVEKYFAATDLVVLPYISATQSGIVQIAYGFEKPVVVTNVGGLPDVVNNQKTGYIVEKENEKELSEAIVGFFAHEDKERFANNIRNKAEEFTWENMVRKIEELVGN